MKIVQQTACFVVTALITQNLAWAAPPPSQQTNEETLWNALSTSAQLDINSSQTEALTRRFIETFPSHPKAVNAQYMMAETEFLKGNFQRAAVRFEAFITKNPLHELADSAAFRLGECYYNAEAYNSAAEAWSRMVTRYRHSALVPNALEYLTIIYMRSREWGKADEAMTRLRVNYPEYAMVDRVREHRGIILFNLDDYHGTARAMEGIEDGKGAYYRGLSYFNLTLFQDAINALKFVGQDATGPYAESATFLKAEGFFQKRSYNIAAREFQGFIKRFPRSSLMPYAELRLAACSLLVRQASDALASVERALKGNPPVDVQAYGLFIKGSAFLDLNRHKEAVQIFGRLANSQQFPALGAAALVRKAWAHRSLGEVTQFVQALKQLEEQYPESPQMSLAKFLEGSFLFEQGRWDEAGSRLEFGIIRYPYNPISEAGLALMTIAYTKGNKLDHLVTAANSALKLFEGYFTPQTGEWRAQAIYFVGKAYYDMKRFKDALPYFEQIALKFSEHALSPRAQLYLAWCLVETGNLDKARERARLLTENPKTEKAIAVNAKFLYAVSYFNSRDYDRALTRLEDFIKNHPKDSLAPQARYLMGLSYHQKKVFGSAIDQWVRCIKDHPDHPLAQDAYLHIGDLYFRGEKYEEAAKFFADFRNRWPTSKYLQEAMWLEMQCYFNGKIDESAVKIYPVYLEKFPQADNIADAERQLEIVYFRRGAHGDPKMLAEFLDRYPKSPYAPSARFKLGDMAMEQKLWGRASEEMEQFVRNYPRDAMVVEAQYALGLAYENLEEKQKAMVQYRNIIDQFPSKPGAVDAAFRLGMLFFKDGNFREAVRAFQFAAKQKMSDDLKASVYYNMALSYENLGNIEEAAKSYNTFARITKRKDHANDARLTAGILLKKSEKYDKAVPFFQELLKSSGDATIELQVTSLLAECYNAMGNTRRAMQTYDGMIGMEPAASDVRLAGLAQLAYMLEQRKDFNHAIRVYEKMAVSGGKKEWVQAARERMVALAQIKDKLP